MTILRSFSMGAVSVIRSLNQKSIIQVADNVLGFLLTLIYTNPLEHKKTAPLKEEENAVRLLLLLLI